MNGLTDDRRSMGYGESISINKASQVSASLPSHTLCLTDRQSLSLHGITDVLGFDESTVFLVTSCGRLTLDGSSLHITVLNLTDGVVEVTGKLYGLYYEDAASDQDRTDKHKGKRGFLSRILS